ncbi:hypothetical protein [Armatimonas sp.]|uniref:hypothetical protein n=1 Tax=Armatimonas sp. TaxID=1872638 RepID=UPI00286D020A|nr:hypothetical protein [Armatimonas sp.]
MKQAIFLCATTLALMTLVGCGGGSGDSETGDVTRNLLAGTTEKTWRLVAIKGNATYTGGGVDTPCTASLKKTSNTKISFSCGTAEMIVLRDSGTFNYRGVGGVSWVLSGSTVTLDIGSFGILTGAITVEPTAVGAAKRLRVRQVSRTTSGVRNTDDDGCELIIEEQG